MDPYDDPCSQYKKYNFKLSFFVSSSELFADIVGQCLNLSLSPCLEMEGKEDIYQLILIIQLSHQYLELTYVTYERSSQGS